MVLPSLIRKANDNEILEVWGDGSPIRDFIHCRDVALGMMHLVKNKGYTEPVTLGSGSGISIKQIADIISKDLVERLNGYLISLWAIKEECSIQKERKSMVLKHKYHYKNLVLTKLH